MVSNDWNQITPESSVRKLTTRFTRFKCWQNGPPRKGCCSHSLVNYATLRQSSVSVGFEMQVILRSICFLVRSLYYRVCNTKSVCFPKVPCGDTLRWRKLCQVSNSAVETAANFINLTTVYGARFKFKTTKFAQPN